MDISNKPAPEYKTISPSEWLQESVEDHLCCVLCGSPLHFKHKTDFVEGLVVEDAHCPCCHVRNRQTAHRLQ